MILYLLQGVTLSIFAALMPGPFQTYLLSQALKNGWKRTLPAAMAPLVTDGPIIVLVLFVLIGILVLLVPNETVFEGVEEKDRRWYTNLKLWALTVLTVLFLTYYAF